MTEIGADPGLKTVSAPNSGYFGTEIRQEGLPRVGAISALRR